MKENLPDYDLNTPITYWITGRERLGPDLKALGITWQRFTGTQYQGCVVPPGKVIQLWALWNEGRLMFGPEQNEPDTVASAIMASLKDRIRGTTQAQAKVFRDAGAKEPFGPFFDRVVKDISRSTGIPVKELVKPFKAVESDPAMVVKRRKPQRRVR